MFPLAAVCGSMTANNQMRTFGSSLVVWFPLLRRNFVLPYWVLLAWYVELPSAGTFALAPWANRPSPSDGSLQPFRCGHAGGNRLPFPTRWPVLQIAQGLSIDQQRVHGFRRKIIEPKTTGGLSRRGLPGNRRIGGSGPLKGTAQVTPQLRIVGFHRLLFGGAPDKSELDRLVRCDPAMIASSDSVSERPACRFRCMSCSNVGPLGSPYNARSRASSSRTSAGFDIICRAFNRASWRSAWHRLARSDSATPARTQRELASVIFPTSAKYHVRICALVTSAMLSKPGITARSNCATL